MKPVITLRMGALEAGVLLAGLDRLAAGELDGPGIADVIDSLRISLKASIDVATAATGDDEDRRARIRKDLGPGPGRDGH